MIVCVCNNLNDAKVHNAIRAGARSADEVYAHCGVKRNCGRCQETIKQIVDMEQAPVLVAAE